MKKIGKLVGVCNCICHCGLNDECITSHDKGCEHCGQIIRDTIEVLKKEVEGRDNEGVHGLFDDIMRLRLMVLDPKLIEEIDNIVGDMDFWYA